MGSSVLDIEADPARVDAAAASTSFGRSPWRSGIGPHLLVLTVVLGLLLAVTPTLHPWASDDGSYAHAVYLLEQDGRWYETRDDVDLVADPTQYPLVNAAVDDIGRAYPYVGHPVWVLVLRASVVLAGPAVGFVLPSLAGLVLACAVAWRLAGRLRIPPWLAFWLTATGPLLVTAFGLWAHTASAALGGAAALALHRLLGRRSVPVALALGLALAAMVVVRTEGVLFAAATVVALAVARPGPWRDVRRAVDPALAGAVAVAAFVGERAVVARLAPGVLTSSGPVPEAADAGWIEGRALGAWRVVGAGLYGDGAGEVLTLGAAALLVAGVLAAGRRSGPLGPVLLACGAALLAVRWQTAPLGLVTGLLPAWPAAVAGGIGWIARRTEATRTEAALAGLVVLFASSLLTFQYVAGGGVEWGGRYLSPVAVPVAILAAGGLARVARAGAGSAGDRAWRMPVAALAASVAVSAMGLMITHDLRDAATPYVAAARHADTDVVITVGEHLPRYDIDPARDIAWLRSGEDGPAAAVEAALDRGAGRVAVTGTGAADLAVAGAVMEEIEPTLAVYRRSAGP